MNEMPMMVKYECKANLIKRLMVTLDKDRKKIDDRYKNDELDVISSIQYKMLVGRTVEQIEYVIRNGGTEDEINKMIEYLVCCIDHARCRLDYVKCYKDLNIGEILNKYYHLGDFQKE